MKCGRQYVKKASFFLTITIHRGKITNNPQIENISYKNI